MKTTPYFEEQVLRRRPYLRRDWIAATLADPLTPEAQPDGRIRLWRRIVDDTGKFGSWSEISETFANRWSEQQVACRLLTKI